MKKKHVIHLARGYGGPRLYSYLGTLRNLLRYLCSRLTIE